MLHDSTTKNTHIMTISSKAIIDRCKFNHTSLSTDIYYISQLNLIYGLCLP